MLAKIARESNKTFVASIHSTDLAHQQFNGVIELRNGEKQFDLPEAFVSPELLDGLFELEGLGRASSRSRSLEGRGLLTLLLAAALGLSLLSVDWTGGLLHSRRVSSAVRIFGSIFTPELSPKFLGLALEATWKTLTFAVTGVTLAVGIGLPLGIAASGVVQSGMAANLHSGGSQVCAGVLALDELVWA